MRNQLGLLIDLDGTLYKGNQIIEGADKLISELNRLAVPYLFITNNSSKTPADVEHHLRSLGINASATNVLTSSQSAATYVINQGLGKRVYCIGENGLQTALVEAGLILVNEDADVVVQGIDRSFTYDKLKKAVRFILAGAPFVCTNPDILLPMDDGLVPGAGSIAASIQKATQKEPIVIGKPSSIIMKDALVRLGMSASSVWMIGDNMRTDIGAGASVSCNTMLVLTGMTTTHNLEEECVIAGIRPDMICNKLEDVLTWVKQQ
jgi:4-nitrophenyl phosphatase